MEKTQNSTDNEMVIDLVQLAKALWHRAWAILLAMVVFGAAAFSYAYFLITPLYKASAMLYVNNSSLSVGSTKVDLSDLNAAQSNGVAFYPILVGREKESWDGLNDMLAQFIADGAGSRLEELKSAFYKNLNA